MQFRHDDTNTDKPAANARAAYAASRGHAFRHDGTAPVPAAPAAPETSAEGITPEEAAATARADIRLAAWQSSDPLATARELVRAEGGAKDVHDRIVAAALSAYRTAKGHFDPLTGKKP